MIEQPKSTIGSRLSTCFVHNGCSLGTFSHMRRRIVPLAEGVVADIGFGSGLNIPFYDTLRVTRVVGIEPDPSMIALAKRAVESSSVSVEICAGRAEDMPIPTASIDTAVVTYALCTIPDPNSALDEIRRILKPGGRLLFVEHGMSDRRFCRQAQNAINSAWGFVAGGCNLNREPITLLRTMGWSLDDILVTRFPLHLWHLGAHVAGTARASVHPVAKATRQTKTRRTLAGINNEN